MGMGMGVPLIGIYIPSEIGGCQVGLPRNWKNRQAEGEQEEYPPHAQI